jgi:lipopolysaccharide/colanic/teichoic acid biosynthesis glycosyltransferase
MTSKTPTTSFLSTPVYTPRLYSAPTHPSIHNLAKRSLDIVGSLVGLTLTGIAAVPIAIAMYKQDPGPLLYSQTRCGLNGRRFRIWKFRSMVVGADGTPATAGTLRLARRSKLAL